MQQLHFSEEERRDTLRRAHEIAESPEQNAVAASEVESYLQAAEETGIPRAAVLAALRERFLVAVESFNEGDVVFAPSADGACYAARIVRMTESEATVTFLTGGDHTIPLASLRPLGLVPGRKLQYKMKDWGWVDGTVISYDLDKQRAKVTAWWEEYKAALTDLRIAPIKAERPKRIGTLLFRTALIAGSLGAALGFLLGHFIR